VPRESIIINDFSGGLCDDPDPRDLKDNEFPSIINLDNSRHGKLFVSPRFVDQNPAWTNNTVSFVKILQPGYGLRFFGSDIGSTGGVANTNYFVLAGKSSAGNVKAIQVIDTGNSPIESTSGADHHVVVSSDTNTFLPVLSIIDGNVRVFDSRYPHLAQQGNKWLGYINRKLFDTTNRVTLNKWYSTDAYLLQAQHVLYSTGALTSTGFTTAQNIRITIAQNTTVVGNWTTQINLYAAYIYDGNQEGPQFGIGATTHLVANSRIKPTIWIDPPVFSKRISGVNIYFAEQGTTGGDINDRRLMFTADFEQGTKWGDVVKSDYGLWANSSITGVSKSTLDNWSTDASQLVETFRTRHGIDADLTAIGYKAITFTNRTAYYGNVGYIDTSTKVRNDWIVKSVVGKPDMTHLDNRLEVVPNDGESIIHMEEYADRILIFKNRTLYILNVAQDIEFLEGQFDNRGAAQSAHVARTEYGIVWFNENGCFLYNGNEILDLFMDLRDPNRRRINLNNWRSFLGSSPGIGYDASDKKIIVADNLAQSSSSVSLMVYSVTNGSWTKVTNSGINVAGSNATNMATDWNGDLVTFASTGDSIYYDRWIDSSLSSSSSIFLQTKDYDFGNPGVRKNFYANILTFKNGANLTLQYSKNGTTELFNMDSSRLSSTGGASYVTRSFNPENSTDAINWNSIMFTLKSTGSVSSAFVLNDAEIIARKKQGLRHYASS